MAVGQNSSMAPNFAEAKTSAKRMFALFDKKPEIDAFSDEGNSPVSIKIVSLCYTKIQNASYNAFWDRGF